ncbi:MAG TPA: quinone oxidoreductase [Casimicrobiaceae bacterium]|nr:quinone oxidoreductase [Casimicrobiaceae bacterium]
MTRAIRFETPGGPDVMKFDEVAVPPPAAKEARVRHIAIGVNYIDTYHRSGLYPLPLPSGVGSEAAGVVEAVGAEVDFVKPGDRVGYCMGPIGAYSESRNVPADRLIPLPDDIPERDAAALMLKGLTVQYLFRQTFPLKGGETILFHAAAGGVGLIACQWARALGVKLIGTAGSDDKAKAAKEAGATHVIVYTRENFVERVKALTDGEGVPVVYDSIGKDTFLQSLDCLAPRGLMVSFGNASGPVAAFNPGVLAQKGSLFLTRPTLQTYSAKRTDLLAMAKELFSMVRAGKIKADVRQEFPLAKATDAHKALESRQTTGATVLIP